MRLPRSDCWATGSPGSFTSRSPSPEKDDWTVKSSCHPVFRDSGSPGFQSRRLIHHIHPVDWIIIIHFIIHFIIHWWDETEATSATITCGIDCCAPHWHRSPDAAPVVPLWSHRHHRHPQPTRPRRSHMQSWQGAKNEKEYGKWTEMDQWWSMNVPENMLIPDGSEKTFRRAEELWLMLLLAVLPSC